MSEKHEPMTNIDIKSGMKIMISLDNGGIYTGTVESLSSNGLLRLINSCQIKDEVVVDVIQGTLLVTLDQIIDVYHVG